MSKPTIVLVHGAFGDASSWRGVFDLLDGGDCTLLAAALPLRGVAADVAYLEAVIEQLDGPVILVGHSYAGCVITVAGASDKVAALVYVAGFVPDVGESIADLQGRFPSLAMGDFLQPRPLPDGSAELSVDPDRFQNIFAPTCPTTSPRSWRTRSVRSWPRRSRKRPLLPPGTRSRRGACSGPETSRSPLSCTASRTTGPARR